MATFNDLMRSALQRLSAGQLDDAEKLCRQALVAKPAEPRALHILGVIVCQSGRDEEGIALLREATSIDSRLVPAWNDLGVAFAKAGKYDEAIVAYLHVLSIDPQNTKTLKNLGLMYIELLRFDEAAECFSRQVQLAPADPDAHWNLAVQLLLTGRWTDGWREFEWRTKISGFQLGPQMKGPRWNGEAISGKTVLVHSEGGFGDAIHFVRYIPLVVAYGANVILECPPELVRLFQQIPGVDAIVPRGQPLPQYDYQIPMMSLPLVFNTTLETIPKAGPYLRASNGNRAPNPPLHRPLKVGLVWCGSSAGDRSLRSRTLSLFVPLAGMPRVTFVSLQRGIAAAEPAPSGLSLERPEQNGDFADTAALITDLDLIISVDTAVAHLAGALGKQVWTLIPLLCDFRWMVNRSDTPWYPTMRLFRQTERGSWAEPLKLIREELRKLADSA